MCSKVCFRCARELPLAEFYAHPQMGDGHLNKCKACAKADARDHYWGKNGDVEWVRRERRRGREKYRRLYRTGLVWIAPPAPPEVKRRAAVAVGNAVRNGRLKKASACEDCGRSDVRLQGHHDDYERPLDVRWLCPKCHRKLHYVQESA